MMDKKPHIKPYIYGMLAGFGAISLSILFFFFIYRFDGFGDAVSTMTGILMPFIYGAVIAYLLRRQMCIFSASLMSCSRKSGCATLMRASAFSQVVRPLRLTQPYSVQR